MRISSLQGDPGHRAFKTTIHRSHVVVRVDGKEVAKCVTADTKRGYATVYDTDDRGMLMLNAARTAIKKRQIHGRVEIEFERRKRG